MHTVIYDGTYDSFLCAVFDVYYYKFTEVDICTEQQYKGNIFQPPHRVYNTPAHRDRVYKGLEKRITAQAMEQLYRAFLSELPGMENTLLHYIQYAFSSPGSIENDCSHPAVLAVTQTAKKVDREKHRMEAFVRFQKTRDNFFFAQVEPDYNVLPLIIKHFKERYADQVWVIYDSRRRYGFHYDLHQVAEVQIAFNETVANGKQVQYVYEKAEERYQQLWQQYFTSINIPARKNIKLHLQHMPKRYWKYLPEKKPV